MHMMESTAVEPEVAARLMRQYHEGRRRGRVVDVLDVFATDAVLEDERGRLHRGIKEIAATFARERKPVPLEVLSVHPDGAGMTATVRVSKAKDARTLRETFGFARGRVRSLRIEPVIS